jgi:hypothetical protein
VPHRVGVPTDTADEPDVSLEFRGPWQLACKTTNSASPVTLLDRLEEGVTQALRGPANYGLVVLGVGNRIDHEAFLPLVADSEAWASYEDARQALGRLSSEFDKVAREIRDQAHTRLIRARDDPRFRGVLFVGHTVCLIQGTGAILSSAKLLRRGDLFPGHHLVLAEEDLVRRFGDHLNKVFAT